ncbi:hypothetical protein SESBI_32780 [Sesbania bispinosa]|nr:hypothetical protein SESBI_32780 [Sesbania bispinosa]
MEAIASSRGGGGEGKTQETTKTPDRRETVEPTQKGEIYDEVSANLKSIKRRLKNLSMNKHTFSIDEAIEISDAATLLRLLRKPEHEIELAGQLAYNAALLMLQADLLTKKARELLSQSKTKLQSAAL